LKAKQISFDDKKTTDFDFAFAEMEGEQGKRIRWQISME